MKGKVQIYVTAVFLLAALGAAGVATLGDASPVRAFQAALCFAFLGVFAQLLKYKTDAHTAATIVFIPFLATLFLAPSWIAIAAIAIVACLGAFIRRQSPLKAVFNISHYILVASVSVAVYRSLGGVPLLSKLEFNWLAYVSAYATFVLLNGLLVCIAIALSGDKNVVSTWLAHARNAITYDVLSMPLAYLFAAVEMVSLH